MCLSKDTLNCSWETEQYSPIQCIAKMPQGLLFGEGWDVCVLPG